MNKKIILISLMHSSIAFATSVDDLKWIAQDYQPYSYADEKAHNKGLAIDVAFEIMKLINTKKKVSDIEIHHFSRSFIRKNNDENTIFFPLLKTAEREKYFKWIGPIAMDEPVIFALKTKNIKINGPDDLKKYTIAAKEGYGAIQSVEEAGIKKSAILKLASEKDAINKFNLGATDLLFCNRLSCLYAMKSDHYDIKNYDIIYSFGKQELSFAVNKDTDEAIIKKLDEALNQIKSNGEYMKILSKY